MKINKRYKIKPIRNPYPVSRKNRIGFFSHSFDLETHELLPETYNQKRIVHLNYETLGAMYHQRRHHKIDEWHVFCDTLETLPYSEFITRKFE